MSDASTKWAHAARITTKGKNQGSMTLEDLNLGQGDNRFTDVVVSGSTIYAAGYGKVTPTQNKAFLRAYNATTGDPIGEDEFTLGFDYGVKTTGLAAGKNGVYFSGYGESASQTAWVVMGYTPDLSVSTWQRFGINLNGGLFDQALDIAVGAQAVIAVGQVKNGDGGNFYAGVEAYAP